MSLPRRWLLLALLGMAAPVVAAPLSEADVRGQAERFVQQHYAAPGNRVEVKSESLDARLRIGGCALPLIASLPGGGRMTPSS